MFTFNCFKENVCRNLKETLQLGVAYGLAYGI